MRGSRWQKVGRDDDRVWIKREADGTVTIRVYPDRELHVDYQIDPRHIDRHPSRRHWPGRYTWWLHSHGSYITAAWSPWMGRYRFTLYLRSGRTEPFAVKCQVTVRVAKILGLLLAGSPI